MSDVGRDLGRAVRPGTGSGSRRSRPAAEHQGKGIAEAASRAIPVVRWGPATIERRHLFAAWHEMARPLMDTAPLGPERSFCGGGEIAKIGDVILTRVYCDPQRFVRGRRHIDNTNLVSLQLYTRGGFAGTRGGVTHALAPDRIALVDFSHEHEGVAAQPSEILGVSIGRDRIATDVFEHRPTVTWPAASMAGRLLIAALQSLYHNLDHVQADEAQEASAGMIGLINGLLGSRRALCDPRPIRQAKLAAVERYIDRHLHDQELNAAAIGRIFGCSRTRLYELFREHGGIAHYLCARRLGRCFGELLAAEPGKTKVRQIAERWGFYNPSHFHRLFKQHFDARPSDVLDVCPHASVAAEPRSGPSLGHDLSRANGWFCAL